DVGHTLRVEVTGSNSAGSQSVLSPATAVVRPKPGPPPPPPPPPTGCVGIASVSLPDRLVIDQVQYNPTVIHTRDQPLIARFHVASTRARCVSGALVYAV